LDNFRQIFATIGELVAYTGVVGLAAFAIFKLLGEKWLENKFAERLEAFKHRQNQELQELKLKIDTLFDRTIKLHQREFEVLPQAWSLLDDAFAAVRAVAVGFQQYPNVDGMNTIQLDEWLGKVDLAEWQKNELRATSDKNQYYSKALSWRQLGDAERKRIAFHLYIGKNGIFMTPEIKDAFYTLNKLMIGACVEREINLGERASPQLREATQELNNEGLPIFAKLETAVHDRLWSSTRAVAGVSANSGTGEGRQGEVL
jgi:hypothetical protein